MRNFKIYSASVVRDSSGGGPAETDNLKSKIYNPCGAGFTLLEVIISLAIVGGLLVTLIYTLNYHLGIADRHETITVATNLAKEKIYEMEKRPLVSRGQFEEPYASFSYETIIRVSSFPGMTEIGVVVRNGKDEIKLGKLIRAR